MKKLFTLTFIVAALIFTVACWRLYSQFENYDKNAANLQRTMSFQHETPVILIEGKPKEEFSIWSVPTNSLFSKAGVNSNDIVISHQVLEFYQELQRSKGRHFNFVIVNGGNGIELSRRSRKEISIFVPDTNDQSQ